MLAKIANNFNNPVAVKKTICNNYGTICCNIGLYADCDGGFWVSMLKKTLL